MLSLESTEVEAEEGIVAAAAGMSSREQQERRGGNNNTSNTAKLWPLYRQNSTTNFCHCHRQLSLSILFFLFFDVQSKLNARGSSFFNFLHYRSSQRRGLSVHTRFARTL